jgi:PEGA domain
MRSDALPLAALLLGIGLLAYPANAQSDESSSSTDARQHDSNTPGQAKAAETPVPENAAKDVEIPVRKSNIRWHLGTISVGAGYSSGPYYGPYGYYPYGPYALYPGDWVYSSLWDPMWGGYPYYASGSFAYNNGRGELRLTADPKLAEVYIDGAYAGTADRLKSMWLDPGAYDLTVSAKDRESFHQRVYVLSGKSLKITAKLGSDGTKEKL